MGWANTSIQIQELYHSIEDGLGPDPGPVEQQRPSFSPQAEGKTPMRSSTVGGVQYAQFSGPNLFSITRYAD